MYHIANNIFKGLQHCCRINLICIYIGKIATTKKQYSDEMQFLVHPAVCHAVGAVIISWHAKPTAATLGFDNRVQTNKIIVE